MSRLLLCIFIVLGLLVLSGNVIAQTETEPLPDLPFFENDGLMVIAHQGGDGLRPSNTMSAFENAMALGVDVLEMDIHSTSDDVLVTIHDDTVDRTTDGTGLVHDFTFEELQQLDAGYDWPTLEGEESTEHPFRGQGITIPALEEILQVFPDMRMNIEIKQAEPSITQPFCDMLRDYEMTDQVLVASFSEEVITEFREVCPEVPTSGVEAEIFPFYLRARQGNLDGYEPVAYAFQVPETFRSLEVLLPEFVAGAQSYNIAIHAWTINTVEDMQRVIDTEVDGIITDYPDRLLELLGRLEPSE